MTNYSDNPFAPGMVSDAFIPDQLIAGDAKQVRKVSASRSAPCGEAIPINPISGRIGSQPSDRCFDVLRPSWE